MERLTGARNPPTVPPKAPSQERLFIKKTQTNPRSSSNQKPNSIANVNKGASTGKPGVVKKDSAKEMLQKMKQIKAQYNNRANTNTNTTNKAVAGKISEGIDKKYP